MIYLPAGTPRRPRLFPEPDPTDWLEPIEELTRPARPISTPPSANSELVEHNFGAEAKRELEDYRAQTRNGLVAPADVSFPLWEHDFEHGVSEDWGYCQTGGHAHSVQHPLGLNAARIALGAGPSDADARVLAEAEHWLLLFQAGWVPGDMILYWMIRDDDLTARRFDRIWCGAQR